MARNDRSSWALSRRMLEKWCSSLARSCRMLEKCYSGSPLVARDFAPTPRMGWDGHGDGRRFPLPSLRSPTIEAPHASHKMPGHVGQWRLRVRTNPTWTHTWERGKKNEEQTRTENRQEQRTTKHEAIWPVSLLRGACPTSVARRAHASV